MSAATQPPPPLPPPPPSWRPDPAQQDRDHLRMLQIGHWVAFGLSCAGLLFLVIHYIGTIKGQVVCLQYGLIKPLFKGLRP